MVYFYQLLLITDDVILKLYTSLCQKAKRTLFGALYTHTVLLVVVGPYTFKSRIHKVAVELPNIIEGLVGIQLCTLFVLQICLTDGTANTTFS